MPQLSARFAGGSILIFSRCRTLAIDKGVEMVRLNLCRQFVDPRGFNSWTAHIGSKD
jgi:hypothetical protein